MKKEHVLCESSWKVWIWKEPSSRNLLFANTSFCCTKTSDQRMGMKELIHIKTLPKGPWDDAVAVFQNHCSFDRIIANKILLLRDEKQRFGILSSHSIEGRDFCPMDGKWEGSWCLSSSHALAANCFFGLSLLLLHLSLLKSCKTYSF